MSSPIKFPIIDYWVILPELMLLGMICFILLVDLFLPDRRRIITYFLAQVTLVGLAVFTVLNFAGVEPSKQLNSAFVRDRLGDLLKISVYLCGVLVFWYSKQYLRSRDLFKGEYYLLGLFGVLGMMIMISSHSFLTLYLGIEVLSLSLYAMVAFQRDSAIASEAAIKYFVLGAIASGMLLYGISMIYGATGQLEFDKVARVIATDNTSVLLGFGLVFVMVGLAFKLGAVPFHMWLPDVYHGAPTSVTLYLGSLPKLAGYAITVRLLVDALPGLMKDWQPILIILSVLSLAIGNIVAIAQTNLKRMLAYSTIAHVGFLLLGFIAGNPNGYSAALFYVLTYAITAAAAFGLIILLSRRGFEADALEDFKGLNERNPWFAFMVLIIVFSLAGVPPTVGFFAKWLVLKSVVDIGLTWLALVAVGFAIIGAFYYIRIVKLMYFDKPASGVPSARLEMGKDMQWMLSINSLALLALGLYPGALISVCRMVFSLPA